MIDALAGVNMSYGIGPIVQQKLLSIDDGNVIYDFHFYEPSLYTHKGAPWATVGDAVEKYPDENLVLLIGELDYDNDYNGSASNSDAVTLENTWQLVSSDFVSPDDSSAVCGQPFFIMEEQMLESDIVYFDNYVIEEKSPDGSIMVIREVNVSKNTIDTYYHISNESISKDSFLRIKNVPN